MKKLLLVITLVLTMGLGACGIAPDTYVSQDEFDGLEERVIELEATLESLVCSVGLNGQYDCYINEGQANTNVYLSLGAYEQMASETDYLDKSKFPSYIFDEFGEYISVNELGNLLSQKYLGVESTTVTGFQYKMQVYRPSGMDIDEYMTRLCMMIIELSEYDFYTIDSPELYIEMANGGSQYIKVRMSLLVTDKYSLHPAIFWNELMDTRIEGITFDTQTVQTYYDTFVLNDTFSGYVLDYNK